MKNLNIFTVSLLATAIYAQKYATCVLQDELTTPENINGRLMFRESLEGNLVVSGFLSGFQSASSHSVAVNDSTFDNVSCASTGQPLAQLNAFTPLEVVTPDVNQCYKHLDSTANLQTGDANNVLGLGLAVYDSLVIFDKLACCTITELLESQYFAILTSIETNLGCQEPVEQTCEQDPT